MKGKLKKSQRSKRSSITKKQCKHAWC